MKKFLAAAIALPLLGAVTLTSTAALADDDDRRGRYSRDYDRYDRWDDRWDRRDYKDYKRYQRARAREDLRDYKAYRRYIRGERLERAYLADRYYVRDYYRYGLYAPPRGYRWQRVNNDYVLVALTTGIIAGYVLAQ